MESEAWRPILDRALWDSVRAVLTDPARRSGPGNARRWLLSGIARCGRCDTAKPMQIKWNNAGPRYTCGSCGLSVEAAKADEAVVGDLLGVFDKATWRRLRRGRRTSTDSSGFEEAMATLTARFVAGDLDGAELAALAEGLRRQQDAASAPAVQLPDVPDLARRGRTFPWNNSGWSS